jgi:ABC-2 type transport system permease protein
MLKGMTAIWKREMRKWWRSKVQLISSLLLPVLFLLIVGNAYSGTFTDIPIAVINYDSQTPGQVYYESLQNSTELNIVYVNISVTDAQKMIDEGQIAGFILIPENFSYGLAGLATGVNTVINVTIDNTNLLVSQALKAIAAQALNTTVHDTRVINWFLVNFGFIPPTNPTLIRDVNRYGGTDYQFIDFLAPGILAMTILFTSLFAAGMPVILDREVGYFDMLISTPASRSSLVLGFTFAGVTKVTAQATFVLLIALLLGVHVILNPLSILYLYIMVILLALGFVGVSIALSVKIDLTAFQFVGGLINFPVFFLSGAFYPVESLPLWLKDIVIFNPMTYAVHALRGIMIKGTSLLFFLPDLLVVGIFAVLTQLLGNLMFYLTLSGKSLRRKSKKSKNKKVLSYNELK